MSVIFKRGNADLQANLTPMIDVTFLLIVFFVLVSQLVEVESVDMKLPAPEDPATVRPGDEQRAVINVLPLPDGTAGGYRLGGRDYAPGSAGVAALQEHLRSLYQANPTLHVNLRADRRTEYRWIEPVMQAVASAAGAAGGRAAGPRVNLVVVKER